MPFSQREGLLSELNFFRNLDDSHVNADISDSSPQQQKTRSSSSDTCSEVAELTENLEPHWSELGAMDNSTQHIDIAAWLDSAIASSALGNETPPPGVPLLSSEEESAVSSALESSEVTRPAPTYPDQTFHTSRV